MTTSPVTTAAPNQPVARRLAGARVVVTGGAWGVGAEIAARLDGCFVTADLADAASTASAVAHRREPAGHQHRTLGRQVRQRGAGALRPVHGCPDRAGSAPDVAGVAGVAAFLVSPDSDYLTGQASNVCGGMHLG